jgi:hypothetical protein
MPCAPGRAPCSGRRSRSSIIVLGYGSAAFGLALGYLLFVVLPWGGGSALPGELLLLQGAGSVWFGAYKHIGARRLQRAANAQRREAMRQGALRLVTALGRAVTANELGERMKISTSFAEALLTELSAESRIRIAPTADVLAFEAEHGHPIEREAGDESAHAPSRTSRAVSEPPTS